MSSMTFLALVQRAYRESGMAGTGPVSVLNQIGRSADMANWVLEAHEEIQLLRQDWSFDWASSAAAPFTLTANVDTFNPVTDFGITAGVREFSRAPLGAYAYPTTQGAAAAMFMGFLHWEQFRGINIPVVAGSFPEVFSVRPDGMVVYYPRPSVECKAVHEYFLAPQVLAADTDVPRMPARFHMAIVWKAVMIGCGKTKDFSRFDTAQDRYETLRDDMLLECTPRASLGGALA